MPFQMKPKKEPTAAQLAARERMSKCSLEWKEAKAGGKKWAAEPTRILGKA